MISLKAKVNAFFHSDSSIGVMLFSATILAIILENSPFVDLYHFIKEFHVELSLGSIKLDHDLHYWVNETLMALFFLLVGLEIKREILIGQLASIHYVILPAVAAIGGIVAPAMFFWFFNGGEASIVGWAVPTATDIAFAVGVIALFGSRLPHNVKLFILTLAVIDDIGAVFIIAVFYSESINTQMMLYAFLCGLIMGGFNWINVRSLTPYMLMGALTWFFMLKTGIHPTLAGIVIAFCVPLRVKQDPRLPHAFGMDLGQTRLGYVSPAIKLEASLHRSVSFGILPLFAFMNSGVDFSAILSQGTLISTVFSGVTAGVFLGLFFGKPLGMMAGAIAWKLLSRKDFPSQIDYLNLLGMGFICGIGYTMSILISTIAFEGNDLFINRALVGILLGSFFSALAGSAVFIYWLRRQKLSVVPDADRT